MATAFAGNLPLAGDILIDSMTTGYRWNSDGPIYYSFSNGFEGEFWTDPDFAEAQIQTIFGIFDYYIASSFANKGLFFNRQHWRLHQAPTSTCRSTACT